MAEVAELYRLPAEWEHDPHDFALRVAIDLDWYAYPARNKKPLLAWRKAAHLLGPTAEKINAMDWSQANMGGLELRLSGLVLIDIDEDVEGTLAQLAKLYGIGNTTTQKSRRGLHLLFRRPPSLDGGHNSTSRLLPKVDVIYDNCWLYGPEAMNISTPPAAMPPALEAALLGLEKERESGGSPARTDYFEKGNRHFDIRDQVWADHQAGVPYATALQSALYAALHMCSPPWGEADARELVDYTYHQHEQGQPTLDIPIHRPTRASIAESMANPTVCYVPDLIYGDLRLVSGPGGVSKTTIELYMALHFAIGVKCFGFEPTHPIRTLIVTKEDQIKDFEETMGCIFADDFWKQADQDRALSNIILSDWTEKGDAFRLGLADRGVAYVNEEIVHPLAAMAHQEGAHHVLFDPLASFTPGEGLGSDGMQVLINGMRMIRNRTQACVSIIHHSGEANAVQGNTGQYGYRGHSNLGDGVRQHCSVTRAGLSKATSDMWAKCGHELTNKQTGMIYERPRYKRGDVHKPTKYILREGYRFEEIVPQERSRGEIEHEQENRLIEFILAEGAPVSNEALRHNVASHGVQKGAITEVAKRLHGREEVTYKGGSGVPNSGWVKND
jgi:RecA-family ATPase